MGQNRKKKRNTKRIRVSLTKWQFESLQSDARYSKPREALRARIVLLSHRGKTNKEIVEALGCSPRIISEVRRRFAERGFISDRGRSGRPTKITREHGAFLMRTASSPPPHGKSHWTLQALRGRLLAHYPKLGSISQEWVRQILISLEINPRAPFGRMLRKG